MNTIQYTVTFKREAHAPRETRDFTVPEAAYAWAFLIEEEGGLAVVTQGVRLDPLDPVNKKLSEF